MRALFCAGLAALCLAPPLGAEEAKKAESKTYQIPYRLTKTNHVLVRVKINGKGPFNFILDTGAPALFVATKVCEKVGVKADEKGWGTFDRFEFEGGAVLKKARGRVEDPFQLEGMNALGLTGAEVHGMIGYNVLARYRIEFDFTKDKMTWTALDFDPPAPKGLGDKADRGSVDAMATLVKVMVAFLGKRPQPEVVARGFLGLELEQGKDGVTVKSVVDKGPAATAGLKPGDVVVRFQGEDVSKLTDLREGVAKLAAGETAKITVRRGDEERSFEVKTGEGL